MASKHDKEIKTAANSVGWVTPLTFEPASLEALLKWLGEPLVQELQRVLAVERAFIALEREGPTFGEKRKELEAVADAADVLRRHLTTGRTTVRAWLQEIFATDAGDITRMKAIEHDLDSLVAGVARILETAPAQGYQTSYTTVIRNIAGITKSAGIKPNEAPASRFFKICKQAFTAIGIHSSPAGSIRAYLRQEDHKGPP